MAERGKTGNVTTVRREKPCEQARKAPEEETMEWYKINLQLFADGGAGGAADGGAAAGDAGVSAPDAGEQEDLTQPRTAKQRERARRRQQRVGQTLATVANAAAPDSASPGTQTAPQEPGAEPMQQTEPQAEEKASFDVLLQDPEYKKAFDKRVNTMFRQRFADEEGRKERDGQVSQLMTTLAQMLGQEVTDAEKLDPKALNQALLENQTLLEAAALEAGVSTQQYKADLQMRTENSLLKAQMQQTRAQQQAQEQENQRRQAFEALKQEAEQLKTMYPQLDLAQMLQDTQTVRTMQALQMAGVQDPVRTAYEAKHRDQILGSLAARAAQTGMQKVAASVAANQQRPEENGQKSQGGIMTALDVRNLTRKQREDINRRVRAGEKIVL